MSSNPNFTKSVQPFRRGGYSIQRKVDPGVVADFHKNFAAQMNKKFK